MFISVRDQNLLYRESIVFHEWCSHEWKYYNLMFMMK